MSINRLSGEQFKGYVYNHLPSYYREQDSKVGKQLEKFLGMFDDAFKLTIDDANGILDIIDPEKTPSIALPYLFNSYGLSIFNGLPESYSRAMLAMIGLLWKYKGTSTVIHYLTALISGVRTTVQEDNINLTVTLDMDFDENDGDSKLPSRENLVRIIDEFIPFYCIAVIVYAYHFSEVAKLSSFETGVKDTIKITNEDEVSIDISDVGDVDKFIIKIDALHEEQFVNFKGSDSLTNRVYNQTNSTFKTNQTVSGYDTITRNGVLGKEYVFNVE